MALVDEYAAQHAWRDWERAYAHLGDLTGRRVVDIGCAIGDQALALAGRGAEVVGIDCNEELLAVARGRGVRTIAADARAIDLRAEVGEVDGIWMGFSAAYFTDLASVLPRWLGALREGGFVAIVECDDLMGQEPMGADARATIEAYYAESLAAGRYDFLLGTRIDAIVRQAGLEVVVADTLPDQEIACDGPVTDDVLAAWRRRLARMTLLSQRFGPLADAFVAAFLGALVSSDHRARARVWFRLVRSCSPSPVERQG